MTATTTDWPAVRTFRGDQLTRLAMPVGGIGTGCVSLGGRGQLTDWEILNRPAKGFQANTFFAISIDDPADESADGRTVRVLERELSDIEYAGADGSRTPFAGLPRFSDAVFEAGYPFGRARLSDPELPVTATIGAFNPLIPGDAEASGIPLAVVRIGVHNPTDRELSVTVCGTLHNIAGTQPGGRPPVNPPLTPTRLPAADRQPATDILHGATDAVAPEAETFGTMAIGLVGGADAIRPHWTSLYGRLDLLDVWDELTSTGLPAEPIDGDPVSMGSLTAARTLAPGATTEMDFLIGWHFPNRHAWGDSDSYDPETAIGNHYATRYTDAADVLRRTIPQLGELERASLEAVGRVTGSGVPEIVQDAVLSNLAVLKSPTVFRAANGRLYGWEGVWDTAGSCFGSCTHVWNYQYAVEDLFPDLAWGMRRTEFVDSLQADGFMSFRTGLPAAENGSRFPVAAADGQFGTVVRLYRLWRSDPQQAPLAELWPAVRMAVEFAWIPGGWDADQDGLMEGCQHNTMDVEFYGPSGYVQSWYLAGLAAAAELAEAVGDNEFADRCRDLLSAGSRATDDTLFNGSYYQQRVIPPTADRPIADGLRHPSTAVADGTGARESWVGAGSDPDLQVGDGCQADQLAGYWMGTLAGLQIPLNPQHVAAATGTVLRENFLPALHEHTGVKRTYAAADEAGTVNASYPRGNRPRRPFPYASEFWTGIEYTAAIGLAASGRHDDAERIVHAVRDRYDGVRRNPFDEIECGHHYARSLASWGLLAAWRHGGATGSAG